VVEVNFGAPSLDRHQANMRAYMWNLAKEWLPHGAIDASDEKLALDLGGPGAHIRNNGQLVIESKDDMKKRGLASPDDGDALVLTFAQPVAPLTPSGGTTTTRSTVAGSPAGIRLAADRAGGCDEARDKGNNWHLSKPLFGFLGVPGERE